MTRKLVPWLVALLAALHAASFIGYGPCDDDFITYRYARNLVEGQGLVFNLGERVEGFSVPGWMLLVALALRCGIDPALFSVVTAILASGVAAFCVARVWQRAHPEDRFAAPAWLVAASPALAWHAIVGLGTVLLAALLAAWLDAWDRAVRRERTAIAAAVLLGLACLVRNEAVLFALPFLALEWRRGKLAPALVSLAPLAAWQAFRVLYFGRWTPVTWSVKKLAFADDVRLGLAYLAESNYSTGITIAALFAVLVIARRSERIAATLVAAAVGLLAHVAYVIYVGGDFFPLARFYVPVLPLAALILCEGVALLVTRRVIAGALFALAIAWLHVRIDFDQLSLRPKVERAELKGTHDVSEPRWAAMGRTIARRVPPSTKVALAPIGAFGYQSRLYIVDMLGLTNTAILEAPPDPGITIKGHQRYDADWVLAQRPEMIVIGNGWLQLGSDGVPELKASHWEGTLVNHPGFKADYEALSLPIEGSYDLLFHWRRDVPRPAGAVPR